MGIIVKTHRRDDDLSTELEKETKRSTTRQLSLFESRSLDEAIYHRIYKNLRKVLFFIEEKIMLPVF